MGLDNTQPQMKFSWPSRFPWGDTVDKFLFLSWNTFMCTLPDPCPCLHVPFYLHKRSHAIRLRSLNHLCVSVKENSQFEMNLSVVPWFEENLRATAFRHLCEKLWGACPETAAFWWLRQTKVRVHSSCLALACLIELFPYGAEWEKLVVD